MAISKLIHCGSHDQYKSAWLNPVIEVELSCTTEREIGNAHDTHALAVRNIIDEDIIKTFGCVPCKISASTGYVWFDFL